MDPYLGEIRMFGGNFAPVNWAFCDGTIIAISQNNALFSLLGTTYGGDGRVTFGLPDMRGRIPLHYGSGPGLSFRPLGQRTGAETVQLSTNQIPSHTHALQVSGNDATSSHPANDVLASQSDGDLPYTPADVDPSKIQQMSSQACESSGDGYHHNNIMPYQCVSFIICTKGIYPPRS